MEPIDLTISDSEAGFASFGSQDTDDESVVFIAQVSNFSSDDESMGEVEEDDYGDVESIFEVTVVDRCVDNVGERIDEVGDAVDAAGVEVPDILSNDGNEESVDHSSSGDLNNLILVTSLTFVLC